MNVGQLPGGWTLERVREVGQLAQPARLLPLETPVLVLQEGDVWVDLDPRVILDCGGLMLVLDDDRDWWIGQMEAEIVKCWAGYGPNLERALKSL